MPGHTQDLSLGLLRGSPLGSTPQRATKTLALTHHRLYQTPAVAQTACHRWQDTFISDWMIEMRECTTFSGTRWFGYSVQDSALLASPILASGWAFQQGPVHYMGGYR